MKKLSFPSKAWIRLFSILLALTLTVAGFAFAEEENSNRYNPLKCFQGKVGNFYFALSGPPLKADDADAAGMWKDSHQLRGNCYVDGTEYQLCWADISELLDAVAVENPDGTEEDHAALALYRYAGSFIETAGGTAADPEVSTEGEYFKITFDYTVQDSPDAAYSAVCWLDGTQAVCLLAQQCDDNRNALADLQPFTAEHMIIFAERYALNLPVDVHGITADFPCAPYAFEYSSGAVAQCFADDYTFCHCQLLLYPSLVLHDISDEWEEELTSTALIFLSKYGVTELKNCSVTEIDETLRQFDFSAAVDFGLGESFAATWIGRLYNGRKGVWFYLTADTETGRAFIDSIRPGVVE